ncbi:capsular polysaccharide export protein, LipB/KpsS family [Acinetobacter terrae]|uniref:capsular polysaccharide export protein, LipB/KpsS family n=1 Tax=Acinetobacter terrae TaxID=2731247 RepID=UPI0007D78E66|nr:hypothetical protein [Acinetobacter terrae]OAL77443.1 hypothetical protein AY608_07140 [Acinetobacter terrae]
MIGDNIKTLLDGGKLREAIELFEAFECSNDILNLFTRKMFEYKDREILPNFLLNKLNFLKLSTLPIVLSNLLTLSEMKGDLENIRYYILKMKELKRIDIFIKECYENEIVFKNFLDSLIKNFMFSEVEDFLEKNKKHPLYGLYTEKIKLIRDRYIDFGLNILDIEKYILCFCDNSKFFLDCNTIVFKLPPSFNESILKNIIDFYPLNIIKFIDKKYNVIVAPQFSMPGPSFSYPFFSIDNNYLIIDHHKYSDILSNNFIHIKTTHKSKYFLVNNCGYSGWYKSNNYILDSNIILKNEVFFNGFKDVWLEPKNNDFPYSDYILIALQIQADSVQKKSNYDMVEMIKLTLKRFGGDYPIVIRRHPKCNDKELSLYLDSIKNIKNVYISDFSTNILIQNCKFTILCNSSVGWDAILCNKPLIAFGESEYDIVTHRISNDADIFNLDLKDIEYYVKYYVNFFNYFWKDRVVHFKKINEYMNILINKKFDE